MVATSGAFWINTYTLMEKILWADDEIDLLKPHILFLKSKGYDVTTVASGRDALDALAASHFSLVLLDENMPGLSGLETLMLINRDHPDVPVIMITKSEEENIMNQAIGSKIADYLIKPVNPNQILLSIKKNLHSSELVSRQQSSSYQQEFSRLSSLIARAESIEDFYELYKSLIFWQMNLSKAETNMDEMLSMQMRDANYNFTKFVKHNYEAWVSGEEHPLMSHELIKTKVFPLLDEGEKVFFILIDNFRLDLWRSAQPLISEYFNSQEELYTTILPTSTQYARNSIFAGLMPLQISTMYPAMWVDEDEDEGKNIHEEALLRTLLERYRRKDTMSYAKLNDSTAVEKYLSKFKNILGNQLNVVVLNFIDMLSHARTESKTIRELANTDAAYCSLAESWFRHSGIIELFRRISAAGAKIVLTTDHGTVKVDNPVKVVGDRNTNTNLRYKVGKNLGYNKKHVYEMLNPRKFGLPAPNLSSSFIYACNQDYFAYPNNYSYYVQYYNGTFQHGGISMQEMLVPVVTMTPR